MRACRYFISTPIISITAFACCRAAHYGHTDVAHATPRLPPCDAAYAAMLDASFIRFDTGYGAIHIAAADAAYRR